MFLLLFIAWILLILIFAAQPHHRVNVWANYVFVIGIVAMIAYFIGRSI